MKIRMVRLAAAFVVAGSLVGGVDLGRASAAGSGAPIVAGGSVTVRYEVTRFRMTMACLEAVCAKPGFRTGYYVEGRWVRPADLAASRRASSARSNRGPRRPRRPRRLA